VAGADVVEGLLGATTPAEVIAHPPLAQVEMPGELMVRDFMTARVLSVRADATVEEAARLIVRHNVPSLPVVREGALVGFITRGDIVRRIFGP
jgi:CBS domain-containing protein